MKQLLEEYIKKKNGIPIEKDKENNIDIDNNIDIRNRKRHNSVFVPIKNSLAPKKRRTSGEFTLDKFNLFQKGMNINNNIKENDLDNNSNSSESSGENKPNDRKKLQKDKQKFFHHF